MNVTVQTVVGTLDAQLRHCPRKGALPHHSQTEKKILHFPQKGKRDEQLLPHSQTEKKILHLPQKGRGDEQLPRHPQKGKRDEQLPPPQKGVLDWPWTAAKLVPSMKMMSQ